MLLVRLSERRADNVSRHRAAISQPRIDLARLTRYVRPLSNGTPLPNSKPPIPGSTERRRYRTTADPPTQYLVLNLGDAKAITHSVPKTLNPEWNTTEELPVNSIQSLLLDVICWDKDRFGKDYMGEFELGLEDVFADANPVQEPKWYPLRSKKPGKKTGVVSGEVQLQFTLYDTTSPDATAQHIFEKFNVLVTAVSDSASRNITPIMTPLDGSSRSPRLGPTLATPTGVSGDRYADEDEDDDDDDEEEEDDTEDATKPEAIERRKRRLRLRRLRRKRKQNAYEFSGDSDVLGIIFLEIVNITDLPPEHNLTRTSFDMDPFVVASLGKKTYRTRRVRHNLNPVFNEKMLFQVLSHEQSYSFAFTVIDHDKYSRNDFIASSNLPIQELIHRAPQANPATGLYDLQEPHEFGGGEQRARFKRLGLSRSSSARSLGKLIRQPVPRNPSETATATDTSSSSPVPTAAPTPAISVTHADKMPVLSSSAPQDSFLVPSDTTEGDATTTEPDTSDFHEFSLPLKMTNLEKWEDKHNPVMTLRAKYMPYPALRQQFWRAMLRQYDADESGLISKVELTTMLDTLGSTLSESTIDSFFQRFPHRINDDGEEQDLTMDEVVICLEEQLEARARARTPGSVKALHPGRDVETSSEASSGPSSPPAPVESSSSGVDIPGAQSARSQPSTVVVPEMSTPGEEGYFAPKDTLAEDRGEEHVVEIRECPICHQPRLNKRSDADIITHIATCASQDWRQVNRLMMGGFVTASQAQRKWYSKIMTKISYGGYKLGANSANILVQDRITGQINEEKMSVYVRLGIRLLYKGLKSNSMERKQSRSRSVVS